MARRRRFRLNGVLERLDGDGVTITVNEAYGNCPKYIDVTAETHAPGRIISWHKENGLNAADRQLIATSRTFFIGSTCPQSGADASHRGGPAGFLHADDDKHLPFADYIGNAMFNTLGNLLEDPALGLLVLGPRGDRLHITGRSNVVVHPLSERSPQGRRINIEVVEVQRPSLR